MVSSAELNEINVVSIALFGSCFFWIVAYDTAYASDKEDDLDLGINSSAITFGDNVLPAFFSLHALSIGIMFTIALLWTFILHSIYSLLSALHWSFTNVI